LTTFNSVITVNYDYLSSFCQHEGPIKSKFQLVEWFIGNNITV